MCTKRLWTYSPGCSTIVVHVTHSQPIVVTAPACVGSPEPHRADTTDSTCGISLKPPVWTGGLQTRICTFAVDRNSDPDPQNTFCAWLAVPSSVTTKRKKNWWGKTCPAAQRSHQICALDVDHPCLTCSILHPWPRPWWFNNNKIITLGGL